jgi:hypothetical protein
LLKKQHQLLKKLQLPKSPSKKQHQLLKSPPKK